MLQTSLMSHSSSPSEHADVGCRRHEDDGALCYCHPSIKEHQNWHGCEFDVIRKVDRNAYGGNHWLLCNTQRPESNFQQHVWLAHLWARALSMPAFQCCPIKPCCELLPWIAVKGSNIYLWQLDATSSPVGWWRCSLITEKSFICMLRSKRVLARAELRSKRLPSSCSNERISRVRSECFALMQLTCFSNCRTRQASRSSPWFSSSAVKLIDLRMLSMWLNLLRRSREGSAAVSSLMGGATTVGDAFVWSSRITRSMKILILSTWSSYGACSHSRVSESSSTISMMAKWCFLKSVLRELSLTVWA